MGRLLALWSGCYKHCADKQAEDEIERLAFEGLNSGESMKSVLAIGRRNIAAMQSCSLFRLYAGGQLPLFLPKNPLGLRPHGPHGWNAGGNNRCQQRRECNCGSGERLDSNRQHD